MTQCRSQIKIYWLWNQVHIHFISVNDFKALAKLVPMRFINQITFIDLRFRSLRASDYWVNKAGWRHPNGEKNTKNCLFCRQKSVTSSNTVLYKAVRWYLYIIGYLDWCNEWWIVYVGTKWLNQFYISDASSHTYARNHTDFGCLFFSFFFVRLEPITTRWMWIKKMLRSSREFRHFVEMCVRVCVYFAETWKAADSAERG